MKMLPGIRRLFRLSAFRPDPEGDMEAELTFHFEKTEEELLREGYSPTEAREEAHRRFGDLRKYRRQLTLIDRKAAARSRRLGFLEAVTQDFAYVARGLKGGQDSLRPWSSLWPWGSGPTPPCSAWWTTFS